MKCTRPFEQKSTIKGTQYVYYIPCGRCMCCRTNTRKKWTGRILLESMDHLFNSFLTLTYDDDHIESDSLIKEDLTLYLKKIRNAIGSFRYYACGEYGDKTKRPHFHVILFGVKTDPEIKQILFEKWGKGFISMYELNKARASYTARYVQKKLYGDKAKEDPRIQPYAVMSRRPGIGLNAMPALADSLLKYNVSIQYRLTGKLLHKGLYKIGKETYPLDNYMVKKMTDHVIKEWDVVAKLNYLDALMEAKDIEKKAMYWTKDKESDDVARNRERLIEHTVSQPRGDL